MKAFLITPRTLAQRIVRAMAKLRERPIQYEVPPPTELPQRLGAVLQVIYSPSTVLIRPQQERGQPGRTNFAGAVSTVRQYLGTGPIDPLHFALAPVASGQGEALLTGY